MPNQNCNELPTTLPSKRGFKLASLNITSLIAHLDELRVPLDNNMTDILSINETKLDESINDSDLHNPGYEIVRRYRNRHGGGVCCYVKNPINFSIRSDLNMDSLENLCLEIRKPRSKSFIVVTWYSHQIPPLIFSHPCNSYGETRLIYISY